MTSRMRLRQRRLLAHHVQLLEELGLVIVRPLRAGPLLRLRAIARPLEAGLAGLLLWRLRLIARPLEAGLCCRPPKAADLFFSLEAGHQVRGDP